MRTVKLAVAKSQLSRLADQAAAGQEIVITRNGIPVARLVALPDLVDGPLRDGRLRADTEGRLAPGVLDRSEAG